MKRSKKREAGSVFQCLGKVKLPTYAKAIKVAQKLGIKYGHKMGVYSCGICGKYHLTSSLRPHEIE